MASLTEQLNSFIENRIGKWQHLRRMYATIGQILVSEFKKNIETGRPPQWPVSKAAIKRHGQTLRRTGFLMRSYVFNESDTGVEVGPTAPYGKFLYYGVNRVPRSETFVRPRISRGIHKGRFRRFGSATPSQRRGFTFRAYSFGPWDLFYLPPEAIERIKNEAIKELPK